MAFVSRSQMGWMYRNKPDVYLRKLAATGDINMLPKKSKKPKRGKGTKRRK